MCGMSTTDTFRRTKEQIADKVRKLLAQAEDRAATPEEAQSFTVKAQQLMTKYSIELAMVGDGREAHQLVEESWTVEGPHASHKIHMINAVARTNDCRSIYADLPHGRKRIQVVGYPVDVAWVQTLSRSLEIQLLGALASAARDKPADVHGRTFAVAFVQGFIAEVGGRLHRARQEAVDTAQRASDQPASGETGGGHAATAVALVLVAKSRRVDDEFKVRHPRTRTVYSNVRLRSWSGYDPGRAAGRRASLARGSVGEPRRGLGA
jgi:hypothetical protein